MFHIILSPLDENALLLLILPQLIYNVYNQSTWKGQTLFPRQEQFFPPSCIWWVASAPVASLWSTSSSKSDLALVVRAQSYPDDNSTIVEWKYGKGRLVDARKYKGIADFIGGQPRLVGLRNIRDGTQQRQLIPYYEIAGYLHHTDVAHLCLGLSAFCSLFKDIRYSCYADYERVAQFTLAPPLRERRSSFRGGFVSLRDRFDKAWTRMEKIVILQREKSLPND